MICKELMYRLLGGVITLASMLCFTTCDEDFSGDNSDNVPVELFATINSNWNDGSRTVKDTDGMSILEFEDNDAIVVDAWYLPNGNRENATSEPDFMNHQEMRFKKSTNTWDYSPIKYWPPTDGDQLAFFAYHLAGATNCTISYENVPTTGYPTLTFSGLNYGKDMLVAPLTVMGGDELEGDKVSLKFCHIMARIKMKARFCNSDGTLPEDEESVFLGKVSIWNYPEKVSFIGFDEKEVPIWNIDSYDGEHLMDNAGYTLTAGTEYTELPGFTHFQYPFKSVLNGNAAKLVFDVYSDDEKKVDVNGEPKKDNNGNYEYKNPYYVEEGSEKYLDVEFKGGYNYTFLITITPKDIDVVVEENPMADWSDTNDTKHEIDAEF